MQFLVDAMKQKRASESIAFSTTTNQYGDLIGLRNTDIQDFNQLHQLMG